MVTTVSKMITGVVRNWGAAGLVVMAVFLVIPASAQTEDPKALFDKSVELFRAGKGDEAAHLLQRYVGIIGKTKGNDHPDYAASLFDLAALKERLGRHSEAETHYRHALSIWEKRLEPEDQRIIACLYKLGELHRVQGNHEKAQLFHERALTIRVKTLGPQHLDTATSQYRLATVYRALERMEEAETLYKRALIGTEAALGSKNGRVAAIANNFAEFYREIKRYEDAEPLYKHALAIWVQTLGLAHPHVATGLSNLGLLYVAQVRYDDAEALYKKSIEFLEAAPDANTAQMATSLKNLAGLYRVQGRFDEARPLHERIIALREAVFDEQHVEVAEAVRDLASLYLEWGRFKDAEPHAKRVLAIQQDVLGPVHRDVATSLANLAVIYDKQLRYGDAEILYRRAIAIMDSAGESARDENALNRNILALLHQRFGRYDEAEDLHLQNIAYREESLGPDHLEVALSLGNLASLYQDRSRFVDAERLLKRSLEIRESRLQADHPSIANTLNNLAFLYQAQGRLEASKALLERSLKIRTKAFGERHVDVAQSLNNLAHVQILQDQFDGAEVQLKSALAIWRDVYGSEHPEFAYGLSSMAVLYTRQGRYAEAEPLFKRVIEILEGVLGPEHPDVAKGLDSLASLLRDQGKYTDAERLYTRALAMREAVFGSGSIDVALDLSQLALLAHYREDWSGAMELHKRAGDILIALERRSSDVVGQALTGDSYSAMDTLGGGFAQRVRAAAHIVDGDARRTPELMNDAFTSAQWAVGSQAASALARMTARFAAGKSALAHLVRERQDLATLWRSTDERLITIVAEPGEGTSRTLRDTLRRELRNIEERISEIDRKLSTDFADYTSLASPEPLDIETVQSLLEPDEALLMYLVAPKVERLADESFVWAVTKSSVRWLRISLGPDALGEKVRSLRAGFRVAQARGAFGAAPDGQGRVLNVAHELYEDLLAPIEDIIEGKQLIIVSSGALTSLSWHMLLSEEPDPTWEAGEDFVRAAWLVRSHAVTVLPSVASLKALRLNVEATRAKQPFFGIGNPLLLGESGSDERAARYRSCSDWDGTVQIAQSGDPNEISSYFRGGIADLEQVQRLEPLPETVGELCEVARSLNAAAPAIVLGADATETTLKSLNAQNRLADFRIVQFATHGLVTGELEGLAEPALVLTPPGLADETDDGLLTASEAAQLKLDADWVILSACNTAASGTGNAEALSGLVRAFFYAGARAVMVSHWPVNSQAAVELTTTTFSELEADPDIGRAEALRRAMVSLLDSGVPQKQVPSYWAPFVVVGEGRN